MSERSVVEEARALTPRGTVLVVDDEPSVRASVRAILEGTCRVLEAEDGAAPWSNCAAMTESRHADQRMPGRRSGRSPAHQAFDDSIVVALLTAVHEVRTAVEALKRGAYDYLTKPFDVDDIALLVHRALEKRALEREVLCLRSELARPGHEGSGSRPMIGRHRAMVRIYQLVAQLAETPTTVLITGESGTGKELVARAIHHQSPRRAQPFVAVNVAAIPETLIESELFGHERGAFTGAVARKLGKFELAQGGTVFLDEIGDLPADLQASCAGPPGAKSSAWAACARRRWTCGCWRPPRQPPLAVRQRTFARTHYRLNVVPVLVRRAGGARTSVYSSITSSPRSAVSATARCAASRRGRWTRWWVTTGPATCASWKTSSTARWFWPAGPSCHCRISPSTWPCPRRERAWPRTPVCPLPRPAISSSASTCSASSSRSGGT